MTKDEKDGYDGIEVSQEVYSFRRSVLDKGEDIRWDQKCSLLSRPSESRRMNGRRIVSQVRNTPLCLERFTVTHPQ